uniref:S1 motif domain-containing protein n=1 Tax=Soboliphyme baturini TaxID=241478 RepID=A0A183IH12_9BILA
LRIKEDIEYILSAESQGSEVIDDYSSPVQLIDSELAKIYANSDRARQDFPEYPLLLWQAISLARRMQDPLLEFCQVCANGEDILALKYHPLQSMVPKTEFMQALLLEFVNRVNEVGVDVNECLEHPHKAFVLQFVCGLGPRKASYILKVLREHDGMLENRTKLVTVCRMGPKVFMNSAGFIKINTFEIAEKTDGYVEVLDGSRVHPETYEWARKMAVDALEYDDTSEDANPASALEEILEAPDRLKDLDLDAFAKELQRQGYGNKNITLYDIRAELNHRYKDLRVPYRPPTKEEVFNMLTKETPQTFNVGKLVMGRVINIVYRRPKIDQLEQTNPVRNEGTGLWQCPLCLKNDFSELSEVWTHYDTNQCRGQAVGIRVRLENGIIGFIPIRFLSDKRVGNPEDRVSIGMPLYCRVLKVDTDRFTAELSCRSSDLADREFQFRLALNVFIKSIFA